MKLCRFCRNCTENKHMAPAFLVVLIISAINVYKTKASTSLDNGLLVVTIATEDNDGLKRYMRSAEKYDLDVKVFGKGVEWDGGDVAMDAGGGHKINLLKEGLEEFKDREDLIIMFTDSYDVVFTEGTKEILSRYKKLGSGVIFSAEGYCWPDKSLAIKYPTVKLHEKRYLNSGGFMGKAKDIYEIVTHEKVKNKDDDQLYYTLIFLQETLRDKWNIKLDVRSEIFQNLNGALGEVTLKYKGSRSYLYNVRLGISPIVVHGNGPIKSEFNRLANYLADGWTAGSGCLSCLEDTINLEGEKHEDYPTVFLAIFVEHMTPFLMEFFQRIDKLDYPKDKMDLYLHNSVDFHDGDVSTFLQDTRGQYKSVTVINPEDELTESVARNWALEAALKKGSNYLFVVDSDSQLTNPETLIQLIEQNRSVIAPKLSRPEKLWSNFWAALNEQGYYARSEDYLDIVEGRKIGLWNVPHIGNTYLIQGHLLKKLRNAFEMPNVDSDMSFCYRVRQQGIFMFVTNRLYFGHLLDSDEFSRTKNELAEVFYNPLDWHQRYIHENYSKSLDEKEEVAQPCPDVYWFPVVTPKFCWDLINTMEAADAWSNGKNQDPRLAGGYENVPTIDIHMNQVGLEPMWLHFLQKYIAPLQRRVFLGYYHDPPHAIMNFVVRYRPDEQPLLRPHHDASTFTINLALNRPGIDFQGGGCRFLRYNCSVVSAKQGWILMHPGRLTHYHEGLRTLSGTRYIMVSFVDP